MRHFIALILLLINALAIAQTANIRVMSYNLMYYRTSSAPCSHNQSAIQRDNALKDIIAYVNPTVLSVNEIGTSPSTASFVLNNVINTNGQSNYAKALSTGNGSSLGNALFFDTTKVALHSQAILEKDAQNNNIVRVIDLYRLYYKDPKLKLGADTLYFTVASAHLKAGNSSANRNDRDHATKALMNHLRDNVADENVIMCGDFNIYNASEAAFQNLVNYGTSSERFNDPINQMGSWNNNANYAAIHTQSTHASSSGCHSGGGLDDRFDFILASNAIMGNTHGIKYKLNSYATVGNDGNHFNQSINSGTNLSAPQAIINDLYDFSDHLPVILELEIRLSDIGQNELWPTEKLMVGNPFKNELNISNKSGERFQVSLFTFTGKQLNALTVLPNSEQQLPLEFLPKGTYLLISQDDHGQQYRQKLIKQ